MSRDENGIIFDLDGTLLDTKEVIARSLRDTISSFGVNVSLEEMRSRVHLSPYVVVSEYIQINRSDFREIYWRLYMRNIGFLSDFDGVNELIDELRRREYKIGVATSLPENHARRGLQVAGIEEMVDCLVAYHDTEKHKPHPEPVIAAARRLRLNPQETLYIGNHPVDIKAGKGAGAYTGAAIWGVSQEEIGKILAEGPNYVFKSTSDILHACGEKGFLLPCIFALHSRIYKFCSLLERIHSPNIHSMREMGGTKLISNFLSLSEQERIELMDKCSECFKRVISDIPEYCCTICCDEMGEEKYRKWRICYQCNTKRKERKLYIEKVFTIGQERGNLAYAIKAFKGVKGPSNIGLAIPLGILVANWLFEHEAELKELGVEMMILVPSSDERIEEVGFDHISTILVVVQGLVDFIDINFMVLSRCSEVKLKDLSREERTEVIRGAFTLEDDEEEDAIRGKSILILDDVFTTGATTNECARVLKENGARKVYVLAISRAYRST
jgi:phosphoglycolate phosphatase-like HAD superfamily hydrolase/predicted amidophosphoribosyltransferase